MKILPRSFVALSPLFAALLLSLLLGLPSVSSAQSESTEMSVEQLEAFIKEQQEALEAAISERDRSLAAKKEVEDQLAEQQARQEEIEQELKALCEEKAQLDPATDKADCE